MKNRTKRVCPPTEKALLVGIVHSGKQASQRLHLLDSGQSLAELCRLADTAGLEVVGSVCQAVRQVNPATYVGKGKVEQIRRGLELNQANLVVFDDALSPAQHRNLERELGTRVLDRSELILDIFAKHARSLAGKLQVELAQLQYMLPRLRRQWTHLSRLGGGVGTRGPGETQLEVDRRRVREKIARLKRRLSEVERTRSLHRRQRLAVPFPCVALVGYTNSGKSTLMNRLTRAAVPVEDKLFATLDPTVRKLRLPDGTKVMLVDTVGFIHRLPHELIDAFKSTLDEVRTADLLLHVIDSSAKQVAEQVQIVDRVLQEIGAGQTPCLRVWNKSDLLDGETDPSRGLPAGTRPAGEVKVSALRGTGLNELLTGIGKALRQLEEETHVSLELPAAQGELLAWLHKQGRVIDQTYSNGVVTVTARMSRKAAGQLRKQLGGKEC